MTPIISPWVFYLMSVVDGIDFAVGTLFIVSVIVIVVCVIGCFIAIDFDEYEKADSMKCFAKKLFILIVTCLVIRVFVPSEETITKMILAQNVTYERVEAVGDTVETVYNDIMELFDDEEDTDG